ncbi:hypothetical protein BDU57DRAFT_557965 [Ampelomyces quisqualis]|uniref:Uncharacterized protein n=1 Tax=Ampelomyces quisqualis TaxID=50730 RepID=A0A6A5QFI0_AMPQU|nr:hypothetical protein BDU57DRAFT_557965 [Ampelomyces quisqualis]
MPAIAPFAASVVRSAMNDTSPAPSPLNVVCAFPVSGQYGAGSRILYYVLVITCIFARKAEWLRGACLAAALVFPAVASIHGIVLASTHVNGAVDMDIFGAFQFCSIAILAAPLTVRLSRTYFYDPGRNVIFLWTILILAGLVALCVEFYRVEPTPCRYDNAGRTLLGVKDFFNTNATCNLTCTEEAGPFSPLRGGAASEVFVIPVPQRLTFNAAMLLAAGFCIPAILSLIFTWDKILEINWKRRRQAENSHEPVEGANVTVGELKGINNVVRMFLSVVEIPVFSGAVIAILGIGEANFWSHQVSYQTEPMASVGQWAPIAGTVIAALGSLYLLWYKEDTKAKEKPAIHYHPSEGSGHEPPPSRSSGTHRSSERNSESHPLDIHPTLSNDWRLSRAITQPDLERNNTNGTNYGDEPTAGRPRVRQWFTTAANYLGNAAHQKLDVSDYKDQKAHGFPEVPGELFRNPDLEITRTQYEQLREQNSRAQSSYAPSTHSTPGHEGGSTSPLQSSPRLDTSPSRIPKRRDTLEVPAQVHSHRRAESR